VDGSSTDIVLGSYNYLSACADLTVLLGSDTRWPFWLFQENLYATVESSSMSAVVLSAEGQWTSPNEHNTMQFPRLACRIFADPARDVNRNVTLDDTRDKILAVKAVLDKYLHLSYASGVMFGNVRVLRSSRLNEAQVQPVADGSGMRQAVVYYAMGIG
jgi:hypothetical protein